MKKITIDQAVKALKNGDVIAIPTETVYGLAADATNEQAIKKLFELKGRPKNVAISLLIPKDAPIDRWAIDVPKQAIDLAKQYWPGPLTMILKKKLHIPDSLTGAKPTIGLRCPNHPITQEILAQFPQGLAAPSANPYGKEPAINTKMVRDYFENQIKIIDGGKCEVGISSTVIDLSTMPAKILRQGNIHNQAQ